ncbi:MAG: exosome complex RNA-binding protein Rrp4 [Candidatus Thorarchaeota archaeon]|jgi:exosome complex component RRP4
MAVYFKKRQVVVPGELLAEGRYRPSMGTYDEDGKIFSALVGLAELRGNTVKVVPLQGVYIPREGDLVIGTVTLVAGNNWKIDIGGPYGASLHANNALRRPYDDDISRYFDIGDVLVTEVQAFDRVSGPFLTMKGRGLTKLDRGMIIDVNPAKIPRIIGRRGSMINMIKDQLRIQTVVGQNGKIWIRSTNPAVMRLAVKAFRMIEAEAHTSKLTDRISDMLGEEMSKLKQDDEAEIEPEVTETPEVEEEEPSVVVEEDVEAEVKTKKKGKTKAKTKVEDKTEDDTKAEEVSEAEVSETPPEEEVPAEVEEVEVAAKVEEEAADEEKETESKEKTEEVSE